MNLLYKDFIKNLSEISNIHNIPGIYAIYSIDYKYVYIGSSKNVYKRLKGHFQHLRTGNHQNKILQDYVNKRGIDNLRVKFVKLCPIEDLLNCEQFYFDHINPNFNICKTTDPKHDYRNIKRMNKYSKSRRKVVFQYDLKGNFIRKFESIREANLSLGEEYKYTSGISSCLNKVRNSFKGYQWDFKMVNKSPIKKNKTCSTPIEVITENSSIIFTSINSCAKYFNISTQTVLKSVKGLITNITKSGLQFIKVNG